MSSYQVGEDGIFLNRGRKMGVSMQPIRFNPNTGAIDRLTLDGQWKPIAVIFGTFAEKEMLAKQLVDGHKMLINKLASEKVGKP